jgi:hypothetical protein
MRTLFLSLKGEYFDQIKARIKPKEYRLVTPFWKKRLENKAYDRILFTLGYPAVYEVEKRFAVAWKGCQIETITHPHFGPDPVEVFAIDATGDELW